MPERATRLAELHQHLARSTADRRPPDVDTYYASTAAALQLDRLRREHPDWPQCTLCGWPVDPAGADPTAPDRHANQPCKER